MVFQSEGQFQKFPHCKFRENIIKLLHVPCLLSNESGVNFSENESKSSSSECPLRWNLLAVNKYGKVGLYHPEKFTLLSVFALDLTAPMHPQGTSTRPSHVSITNPPIPKCERTHLVTDAIFSGDTCCVIFSTTKNILQWYDIGEIQQQNIGLEIFPRKEFLGLNELSLPVTVSNMGYVESHRLFGFNSIPCCLEYSTGQLFIGDVEGGMTIISIPNLRAPMGRRKVRGKLHKITLSELKALNLVRYYKAHHHPVTDIFFLSEKDLILSCSKDKKFSVFVKDSSDVLANIIVSIIKGVNTIAYSAQLKMIATGSDDHVVRLFNQFIMKMPQMELFGHRSPIVTVEFVRMDSVMVDGVHEENAVILLSYSTDSELRAWDPLTFICLQSLYLSFPIGSTIMCKTPEFSRKSLVILQPKKPEANKTESARKSRSRKSSFRKGSGNVNGTIILLYCNSYARIPLEKDTSSRWPFDYDGFIQEFEELSTVYDKKLKEKLKNSALTAPTISLPHEEMPQQDMIITETEEDEFEEGTTPTSSEKRGKLSTAEITEIESKLDKYLNEILELKQAIKEDFFGSSKVHSAGRRRLFSSGEDKSEAGTSNASDEAMKIPVKSSSSSTPHYNISVEATSKYFEFKREKGKHLPKDLKRMLTYGQAFNLYPTFELQPIEFTRKNLKIPEEMKTMMGINHIDSVKDLQAPEARAYFENTGERTATRQKGKKRTHANHFAVVGHKFQHNVYEEEKSKEGGSQTMAFFRGGRKKFPPVLEEDEDSKSFNYS